MVGQFKQFLAKPEHESEPQPSEAFFWNLVADNSPRDEHPMVYVSWNDVVAYAKWTGTNLLTRWEWESAAKSRL